ncbi:MAG: nitroreductase family protein [Candidatus Pacearchaeota archaeon]
MDIDDAIKERKSVRKFSDKKPDWREILEAIDFTRHAPMAGNLFSLKFILVSDKKTIDKIAEYCQQDFISQAYYVVVVCSDSQRTLTSFEDKGEMYLRQQAGSAMENFMLKLEDLNLSTCWIGYFIDEEIKRQLSIPERTNVEAIFPIGYEAEHHLEKQPRKSELDSFIYFDKYGKKRMND